jgi:hypothetical protein
MRRFQYFLCKGLYAGNYPKKFCISFVFLSIRI